MCDSRVLDELSRVELAELRVSSGVDDNKAIVEIECMMRLGDLCCGCRVGGYRQIWHDGPDIIIYYLHHTTLLHLQVTSSVGRCRAHRQPVTKTPRKPRRSILAA